MQKQYRYGTLFAVPGKYWEALMEVALDNGGYVTPALAGGVGVPAVELRKMVQRGSLSSAGHGVYRMPSVPHDQFDEYILARLWTRGRGVISHDSALVVHELCDISPTRIHLTIPTGCRISRAGGQHYQMHYADLNNRETTRIDAVIVTTIGRTLSDISTAVPTYIARQAVETARQRGAITSAQRELLTAQIAAGGGE